MTDKKKPTAKKKPAAKRPSLAKQAVKKIAKKVVKIGTGRSLLGAPLMVAKESKKARENDRRKAIKRATGKRTSV